jgi:hypothetical protein
LNLLEHSSSLYPVFLGEKGQTKLELRTFYCTMSVATECAMPVPTAASTAFPADEVLSSAPQEATVPEMWEQLQEVEVLPLKEGLQTPTSACTDIELAFSRPQFNDVLRSHFAPSGEYDLDGDLADYIWHLTSGHPSSVRAVLDGIASALVGALFVCDMISEYVL